MKTLSAAELDQAKLDPGSVFHGPDDVLAASLSPGDKKAILLRWEIDAEALMRARKACRRRTTTIVRQSCYALCKPRWHRWTALKCDPRGASPLDVGAQKTNLSS